LHDKSQVNWWRRLRCRIGWHNWQPLYADIYGMPAYKCRYCGLIEYMELM
jgi:hypothetical protein